MKCRAVAGPSRKQLLSPFRSFDFDAAVVVLLSEVDMTVLRAAEIDVEHLRSLGRFSSHVNGQLIATAVVDDHRARDVTERVHNAARGGLELPTG